MWSALIGVIIGAVVAYVPRFLTASQRLQSCRSLLIVEIEKCKELADTYLRDKIVSPSYRLPTLGMSIAFPQLLAMINMNAEQIARIQAFYIEVDAMNRGLDQAEKRRDLIGGEDRTKESAFVAEVNRIKLKADNINRDYQAAKEAALAIPRHAFRS